MSTNNKDNWTPTKDLLGVSLKRLGIPTGKVEEVTTRQKITTILHRQGIDEVEIITTNPSQVLIKSNSPYIAQRARESLTEIRQAVGKEKAVRVIG